MSPLLKDVEKAGLRGLRRKRNPASILPSDFFNDSSSLRAQFGRLINAPDASRIAIVPSVSYGMATVARNLRIGVGDQIIVAANQFPSNYHPWQSLCNQTGAKIKVVDPPLTHSGRGNGWNERILDAIDKNTKAVAIGHVHWADGTLFQLHEIRKRTLDVGAILVVDGTQSVGALPFDVAAIRPDALICAGYKWLLGPYSLGLAYYGEYFDEGKPIEESWMNRENSEDFVQLVNYQASYKQGAVRFEVGENSNFILVPMLLKAIQQLNRWGVENVQQYCKSIIERPLAELRQKGYWIEEEQNRSSHLFGIRLGKKDLIKIQEDLLKRRINVSFRGDAIRVSPHIYNREEDLYKLVKVLSR